MANEPPTGALFRSRLSEPEMAVRLEKEMPEFRWRLGDSDQYRDCYVRGRRADGLEVKITPEDEPDQHYLGVYFHGLAAFPEFSQSLSIARPIHEEVLRAVEGNREG